MSVASQSPAPAAPSFKTSAPCHYRELFVKSDGCVYPCCLVGGSDGAVEDHSRMIIGHVSDPDLPKRIREFFAECSCEAKRLRRAHAGDVFDYGRLNLELSLACQAKCAMCCVFAPESPGSYSLYADVERLIDFCSPREILFQGGEVLVQKKTLDWIAALRARLPGTFFSLATNGNAGQGMAPRAETLFDSVHVSIVGFMPATYKAIMGLDVSRMKRFASALIRRGKCAVQLKFMATPNNVHEIPLFLEWAVKTGAPHIALEGISILSYVVLDTFDDYWRKIFERTGRAVDKCLDRLGGAIQERGVQLLIATELRELLGVAWPRPAAAPGTDPEITVEAARTLALCGDTAGARRIIEELERDDPRGGDPRLLVAKALSLDDPAGPEAAALLRAVLAAHPDHPDVLDILDAMTGRAWPHIDKDDFAPARDILDRVLAARPSDPGATQALAVIDLKRGEHESALDRTRRALAAHPGNVKLSLLEATILARAGRYEQAHEKLDALLQANPRLYTAHLSQSSVHRYAGEYEKALASLDKAKAIHPKIKAFEARERLIRAKMAEASGGGKP